MKENDHLIQYFNAQARLGMIMQHPGGKVATHRLIGFFPHLKETARILELGCGAGRTAAIVLERFLCSYVGIDASPLMLKRARAFLSPHRSRVTLFQFDLRKSKLPFPDNSFDVIFAESVLAILDPAQIIPECSRMLKPDGLLVWNDRIWGNKIPLEVQKELNDLSLHALGFHAASLDPSTEKDWRYLTEACGLSMLAHERLERMPKDSLPSTMIRKAMMFMRMLAHPTSMAVWRNERRMARKGAGQWNQMENWMFVARKSA
jgi:SAM-dependent methyltransferase